MKSYFQSIEIINQFNLRNLVDVQLLPFNPYFDKLECLNSKMEMSLNLQKIEVMYNIGDGLVPVTVSNLFSNLILSQNIQWDLKELLLKNYMSF